MAAFVEYRQEEEMNSKEKKEEIISDDLSSLLIDFSGANLNLDLLHKSNRFQQTLGERKLMWRIHEPLKRSMIVDALSGVIPVFIVKIKMGPSNSTDSESENLFMPQTKSMIHGQDPGADALLNSENNTTTDYDWLLSPPRNPLLSLELEEHKTLLSNNLMSSGQSTSSKSSLGTPPADNISTTNIAPKLSSSSTNGVKSSSGTIRRPSPSRKAPSTGSRSATPTTRATVPSTTKPSRSSTPTSRPTVSTNKPMAPSKRSITPTPRSSTLPAASKSTSRSSTPTLRPSIIATSKSTSRSSTPTLRPSIIATSKSTSRSSTPTQRPSNPSGLLTTSVNGGRSSSVTKAPAPSVKNPASSRGSSPSVKSRPLKNPPEKSLPERPTSVSKGRPGLNTVKLPATEGNSKAIPKRTSCSPSRGQVLNGSGNNSVIKSGLTKSRGYSNGNDDVNPVLMGTKMVERVVNMRKLAPPKQDYVSNQNNTSGKLSVSQDNSGFGRTLSKKSFDMALRHLDIRRSMPGNMRAMITKVPASSVYSVRSESTKTQTINASDSPLATSSSTSSDNNPSFIDGNENGHLYHHDQ